MKTVLDGFIPNSHEKRPTLSITKNGVFLYKTGLVHTGIKAGDGFNIVIGEGYDQGEFLLVIDGLSLVKWRSTWKEDLVCGNKKLARHLSKVFGQELPMKFLIGEHMRLKSGAKGWSVIVGNNLKKKKS